MIQRLINCRTPDDMGYQCEESRQYHITTFGGNSNQGKVGITAGNQTQVLIVGESWNHSWESNPGPHYSWVSVLSIKLPRTRFRTHKVVLVSQPILGRICALPSDLLVFVCFYSCVGHSKIKYCNRSLLQFWFISPIELRVNVIKIISQGMTSNCTEEGPGQTTHGLITSLSHFITTYLNKEVANHI